MTIEVHYSALLDLGNLKTSTLHEYWCRANCRSRHGKSIVEAILIRTLYLTVSSPPNPYLVVNSDDRLSYWRSSEPRFARLSI